MQHVFQEPAYVYGIATGTVGTLAIVLICIPIGEWLHRKRVKRRMRRRW